MIDETPEVLEFDSDKEGIVDMKIKKKKFDWGLFTSA